MIIQRGYRALFLWIVWAAASIAIFTGLYHDTDVLEFVQSDQSRITWIIIGLFLMGIAGSLILTVILTFESTRADLLAVVGQKKGWEGIVATPKKFCVARYYDSMETIVNQNGEVNIQSLIDVEFAGYHRFAHFLEIIGNLLITLGLIGTVVGLTLTLTGLTGSLEALGHDEDQLLRGLRGAMAGMGTAFYTTLLGSVLGGVLLRIFSLICQNGVDSLEDTLARTSIVHCSHDLAPSPQRDVRNLNYELQKLDASIANLQTRLKDNHNLLVEYNKEFANLDHILLHQKAMQETLNLQKQYLIALEKTYALQPDASPSLIGRIFRSLTR